MADHWFREFAEHFNFPDNYTCVDLETSGTRTKEDYICSIGHAVIRNRQIVEVDDVYLDWTRHPEVDVPELQRRLLDTQRAMEAQGKGFYHTFDRLHDLGEPPEQVLSRYLDRFEVMEEAGEMLVAHNGWRFDAEMLQAHFHNWLQISYLFEPWMLYDSGIIEKASQLDAGDRPLPAPGETMRDFSWRIGRIRARGIFWALDTHCDQRYNLSQKAAELDYHGRSHQSGYDCVTMHCLVEEHRKLADAVDQLDPDDPAPQQVELDD